MIYRNFLQITLEIEQYINDLGNIEQYESYVQKAIFENAYTALQNKVNNLMGSQDYYFELEGEEMLQIDDMMRTAFSMLIAKAKLGVTKPDEVPVVPSIDEVPDVVRTTEEPSEP